MPKGVGATFKYLKDKKIRIVYANNGTDASGFSVSTYHDLYNNPIWAHYRSVSGREFFEAAMFNHEVNAVFTVNYHPEVKAGMHVLFREEAFKILYVDNVEGYKNDFKLHCKTVDGYKDIIAKVTS
jgi:SPP1 family predicted phage head-tail adaptor